METSILLAQIIGPLFVLVGAGVLINPSHYMEMVPHLLKNPALYYLSGGLSFVVGLSIILFHNVWIADWRAAITVIGWMSLIKGVARILVPTLALSTDGRMVRSRPVANAIGVLALGVGLWLSYEGFRA